MEMNLRAPAEPCASDPLKAAVPLPFHYVLFPYGFPVHVKSNDPAVIRAAELSWGGCTQRFHKNPIEIRILISDLRNRRRPSTPYFRAQSNLLTIVADRQNFACCDLSAGFGFACLTKAAAIHSDYLRYHFLEAMAYLLLDTQYLVAIHAACLQFSGHGFLFVGESGAGKSSLAYACARRGWTYISDDASSLVRRHKGRTVLGNPRAFRFRPSVSSLFSEFAGPVKLRNGKPTIEVRTEHLPSIHTASECEVDYVVFLNRSKTPLSFASVSPVSREAALPRLFEQVWPAELPIHEERFQAVERLLDATVCELSYQDLDQAIDLLQQITRGVS
jgi:hypothetical protein